MTDILKRLNTVVTHAEHGVDPYWVEIAAKEIDRLRALIDANVSVGSLSASVKTTHIEQQPKHYWMQRTHGIWKESNDELGSATAARHLTTGTSQPPARWTNLPATR
jgi:hypothetical protein